MNLSQVFNQYRQLALFCTGDVRSMYMMYGCYAALVKAKPYFAKTPETSKELLDYALLMAKAFNFKAELIEADSEEAALELAAERAKSEGYEALAVSYCNDMDAEDSRIIRAEAMGCVLPYRLCLMDEKEACRRARNAGFVVGNVWEHECHDEHC